MHTMTKKVNYPTQIIPATTTHYQWRKAIKEAEAYALNFTDTDPTTQRAYYMGKRDELKAQYADWRKARRESRALDKLIRDQWMPKNWAKLDAPTQGSN